MSARAAMAMIDRPPTPRARGAPRRALFVAYAFPPTGGVSVQRVTKFVKYLPEFGWDCSVLTVANPSVPMIDQSLLDEVPPSTRVHRARTLEPSYDTKSKVAASHATADTSLAGTIKSATRNALRRIATTALQPDPQILWRPHALREGRRLLAATPHDVIVATGPPFSSFLLAATLSRQSKTPLVVDYRDEWAFMTYWENKQIGAFDGYLQARMQARVLKQATLVLGTTAATASELKRIVAASDSNATVDFIHNGFDPSDFPVTAQTASRTDFGNGTGRFRLSFVGTLWNLTSITSVVDGIIALSRQSPHLAANLELVVAGRRTAQQESELDRLATTPAAVSRLPFIAHKEAIRLMCSSDANLLINADLPNTNRLVNAKTFEYMAARRPVFTVAPRGEIWTLLEALPGTKLAEPADVPAIAENLSTAIDRWLRGQTFPRGDWNIDAFQRRELTAKLALMLDSVVASKTEKSRS